MAQYTITFEYEGSDASRLPEMDIGPVAGEFELAKKAWFSLFTSLVCRHTRRYQLP